MGDEEGRIVTTTLPILNDAYHVATGLIVPEYLPCATYSIKLSEKDMKLSVTESTT